MKISKIETQKKNKDRLNIYIDDAFAFGISTDVYLKYNLKKNQEIDNEFIEEILLEEENSKAINSAVKYLSYRQRSIKEMTDYLNRKGYDRLIVEKTLNYLLDKNYLNDSEFAQSFIKDKSYLNKYGINKIRYELLNKGVSKEIIAKTLTFDSDEEFDNAMELAIKKLKSYKNQDRDSIYRKLGGFLQRKGYRYDTVKKVLKEALNEI